MNAIRKMVKSLLIAGLIAGIALSAGQRASAEVVYTYKDQSSAFEINGSGIKLAGEHAVWRSYDKNYLGQIFYGNIRTGQTKAITTHGKSTDSPAVGFNKSGEAVVVWADKRNYSGETPNLNWDIYSYNVSTGKETKLNDETGQNRTPLIDGNYVVWQTNPQYDMHFYDLGTGTLKDLGPGRDPVVKGGRIVYKGAEDGSLYEYSIDTKTRQTLLSLPYTEYVERFVFNGEEILWKQRDSDSMGKYTYMDLGSSSPQPIDLTQPVKQSPTEYKEMSISDGTAVWLEASGDSVIMRGADLKSGDTYNLGLTRPAQFIGFQGDALALINNGSLVTREIIRTESAPSTSVSTQQTEGTLIGPDGGVAADGQAVRLEFGQGTFDKNVQIGLKKAEKFACR